MPLGRKQSAFRKTVSDLKSALTMANTDSGGGGGIRGRKRKLSEPGSGGEEAEVGAKAKAAVRPPPARPAPASAPASTAAARVLPRMGRSLANLASSLKKRGGGGGGGGVEKRRARQTANENRDDNDDNVGEEVDEEGGGGDGGDDDDDGDNQRGHDSTIFEDVAPAAAAKRKANVKGFDRTAAKKPYQKQHQQQHQQQQQQPPSKKERRSLKKKQKKNADLVAELLTLSEELRIDATPAARVVELCDSALKIGRGKLAELASAHDTGRVLEAILKRGGEQHRWLIFEELKDQLLPLAKSKYARFVVQKMLSYGGKEHKAFVFRAIEGHAPELLKHRFASELVETAYNEFANVSQRSSILQEFYGPELALFKSSSVLRLKDALEKRPGLVMQHLQQHLLALTQKDLVRHSLVQHLVLEYLEQALLVGQKPAASTGDLAAAVASLLENLRDNLVPMLHTRDGAKAAMLVVRHLSHKDLKRSLKSMKTFLCNSACNEHGYLFIIGLLECPGLTPEETHKLLLRELFDSLQDLVDSQYGRKVLLYLLSPRDPLHFPPQLMQLIRPPDSVVPADQLRQRLHQSLALCSARLLSHVSGRLAELCQANATMLFVMDTLRHCPGEKAACFAALADLIRQPFTPSGQQQQADESQQHIIERSAGHLMLKRLLPTNPELVRLINDFATDENVTSWMACNRGSFFVLQLYETCPEDCSLRSRIAELFSPASLLASGYKGAQLLADKLQQQQSSRKTAAEAQSSDEALEPKTKSRRLSVKAKANK